MKNTTIPEQESLFMKHTNQLTSTILAILLLLAIGLVPTALQSQQENNFLNKTIPASPTAAALGAYGDNQVSMYSGTPNIDIPLCELRAKDISVPISLSYNASGIKVEQTASNIGLGWSLNAGGVITRTIRGQADGVDENGNLFPSRSYLPLQTSPNKASYDAVLAVAEGTGVIDAEPDIFFYNFNGRSGTFYLDENAIVVMQKYEDLRIQFIRTGVNLFKFIVTTEDGTQYNFEDDDTESSDNKITSWSLSSIVNANQSDRIDFYYDDEDYFDFNPPRFTNYYVPNGEFTMRQLGGVDLENGYLDTQRCRKTYFLSKRLSSIVSLNMGSVEFSYNSTPRLDVSQGSTHGAYALNSIVLKDVDGKFIKNFTIETSFIQTDKEYSDQIGFECPQGETYMNYRMYLDKITESSEKVHVFTYNGRTAANLDRLPNRMSVAQDQSGFYNGKNQNQTLVPRFTGYIQGADEVFDQCWTTANISDLFPSNYIVISGANRDASYPEVAYGTIKSISYPTGGATDFEFELHPQDIIGEKGGIRVKKITNTDISGATLTTKNYNYQVPRPGYGADFIGYAYHNRTRRSIVEIPICDAPIGQTSDDHYKVMKINTGPFNDLGAFSGNHIGYQQVSETQVGTNGINGSIGYSFTPYGYSDSQEYQYNQISWNSSWVTIRPEGVDYAQFLSYAGKWPAGPSSDNSWKRGVLTSKTVGDAEGNPILKEEYLYDHVLLGTVDGIKVITQRRNLSYLYSEFSYPGGWNKLLGKNTYTYDTETGLPVVTNETYEYNSIHHKQVTKSTITKSEGEVVETTLAYPPDIALLPNTSSSVISGMTSRHMISPVLKQETKVVAGGDIGGQIVNYKNVSGVITEKSIEIKQKTETFEPRAEFVKHDALGNLLEQKLQDGPSTSFVWGYQGQYPIVQIQNASYSTMTGTQDALLSAAQIAADNDDDNCKTVACKEEILRGKLEDIRAGFPNAQVSTYTYDPMVGVTSMTDPRGYTIFYHYDSLNRLVEVTDAAGNIVTDYDYHYHGQ